ncbi:unnamed protein product, partial [Protopolystoma xenopodis]
HTASNLPAHAASSAPPNAISTTTGQENDPTYSYSTSDTQVPVFDTSTGDDEVELSSEQSSTIRPSTTVPSSRVSFPQSSSLAKLPLDKSSSVDSSNSLSFSLLPTGSTPHLIDSGPQNQLLPSPPTPPLSPSLQSRASMPSSLSLSKTDSIVNLETRTNIGLHPVALFILFS